MAEQNKRYRAFISYSQKDKSFAKRLHRALEGYRLPRGVEAPGGKSETRKLGRFFRDDDEMGAATDLGAALQGAIADAESLIVICSPNAAESRWVNEEIIHFKRTGRADRIFAIIVDGEPTPPAESRARECFPPALRFKLGADGALTNDPAEPLGLDVRKEPYNRVVVRLAAGLVGISFDTLWKRAQRRARARTATIALALVAATLIVGGAVTQNWWRAKLDAYFRYERFAVSTADLMAAQPGTTFQDCQTSIYDCPVMVVIPEGSFVMGDPPRQTFDAQGRAGVGRDRRRRISIARFAVSRNEIRFEDWQTCVRHGGCNAYQPKGQLGEGFPVVNVSWNDAQRYAAWLSSVTGREYRLLTEAEWEYAARGVTSAESQRNGESWSFGNDESQLSEYAWFSENAANGVRIVQARRANPFGLYDMHGNAFEWVEDCYAPYDPSKLDSAAIERDADPSSVARRSGLSCSNRVLRGGAYLSDPASLRSAARLGQPGGFRYDYSGFRVARTP